MIDILLAFDNDDATMGQFNQGCLEDYLEHFNDKQYGHNVTCIEGRNLNDLNVELRTNDLGSFIFVAYSHGESDCLSSKQGSYIATNINNNNFGQSLFYTVSCYSANELGKCLIESGCYSFFGYKNKFQFWFGYKSFSACANYGLFLFLQGMLTDQIYEEMIDEYNKHIDEMVDIDDFMIAALLLENRDALVKLGSNISIDAF